jgi:hypothetical protein
MLQQLIMKSADGLLQVVSAGERALERAGEQIRVALPQLSRPVILMLLCCCFVDGR